MRAGEADAFSQSQWRNCLDKAPASQELVLRSWMKEWWLKKLFHWQRGNPFSMCCFFHVQAHRLLHRSDVTSDEAGLLNLMITSSYLMISKSSCGLVAMTSASHAEGRQFDPGQVYVAAVSNCNG